MRISHGSLAQLRRAHLAVLPIGRAYDISQLLAVLDEAAVQRGELFVRFTPSRRVSLPADHGGEQDLSSERMTSQVVINMVVVRRRRFGHVARIRDQLDTRGGDDAARLIAWIQEP